MLRFEIDFLFDIETECDFIIKTFNDISYSDFIDNDILKRAVARSLEIIGEAVKNISKNTRSQNPEIYWKEIAGLRDKLIHHYFGIDYELVWEVIQNEVPDLYRNIKTTIKNIKK